MICKILLASILSFFVNLVCGQSTEVIIYRAANTDESQVIDKSGNVIFRIPSAYSLIIENCEPALPSRSTFYSFDFADGPITVQNRDSTYLYDQTGKRIAGFNKKEVLICNSQSGFIKASYPTGDYKKPYIYSFINKDGKPAFDGKRFNFLSSFNEGYAVVEPVDENESWQIISEDGKKTADFPAEINPFITEASTFSDGLTMVSLKAGSYGGKSNSQQHIFFDKNGKQVLNMENVTGRYNGYAPQIFKNNISYLRGTNVYEFSLFDKSGKLLANKMPAGDIEVSQNLILLTVPKGNALVKKVYDHQFNEIALPSRPNTLTDFAFITDDHIGIYKLDSLSKEFGFELIDPESMSIIYSTSKVVINVINDFVLIGDPRVNKLNEIEDLNNNVIFGATPETKVYTSFKEGLPVKEVARHLKLNGEKSMNYLCSFSALRTLEINNFEGKTIPVCMGYMQHLKELRIYNASNLEEIPKSVTKLPSLEYLFIHDSPKITNLEEIIEGHKGLKSVILLNMDLSQEFIRRMERERPAMKITSWQMK